MPDADGIEDEEWIEQTKRKIKENKVNTQYTEED